MMEIWHNPRCSKSRATLEILEEGGVDPLVRRYLDDPPTVAELRQALAALDLEPWDIVRFNEDEAKELGMDEWPHEDRDGWLEALASHPRLIQRPIVIDDDGKAVIGRPPENVRELL